ncbi:LacI family DNA-binding transcriptional regulator [Salinicola sp. JS01]|uniref:LacI family DNA-binding transcriptional regulator n=1 Tax=Salinicola sp. JS01 TaxID=3050071 RepID=UPI00255BCCB0|nr:LacI family DNA-binding transcriptional regulator [Salinicola sp. JS01]WIX32453.1 LacI family DNA-binding transcriptional regulator [Salinicola sp. JS01]
MASRPSLIQVAEQVGVSPATVSRAFNRPELLNAATRERILSTAKRLGFRPNKVGRSLRSGSTRTLGLLLPTLANPVFAACFEGAEAAALDAGYSVMLATTGYDSERERLAARSLLDHRVEGLILTVADPADSATLNELGSSGVPFVLAYNESDEHPCVSVDNHAAAGDMVSHLAAQGHRQLALISGPLAASDRAARRLTGAMARAETLGLPAPIHVSMSRHTAADRCRLKELLAAPQPPSALFCSNDLLAAAVIAELATLGRRVPDDLSVCGFDGMDFGALMVPSLASVHQPSREIGSHACRELLAALAGRPSHSQRLPHRLLDGGTVTAPVPP